MVSRRRHGQDGEDRGLIGKPMAEVPEAKSVFYTVHRRAVFQLCARILYRVFIVTRPQIVSLFKW